MNQQDWVTRHHVVMFADVHDFSLVRDRLGEGSPGFLQDMYQALPQEDSTGLGDDC